MSSLCVKNFNGCDRGRSLFTLLSWQVVYAFCAISSSLFSSCRFAPGSSAKQKPDQLPWWAWALFSVFLQFPSRRLPLSLQLLPLEPLGSRPCIFPGSILNSC